MSYLGGICIVLCSKEEHGAWIQINLFRVLSLPLISSVTLGNLLNNNNNSFYVLGFLKELSKLIPITKIYIKG